MKSGAIGQFCNFFRVEVFSNIEGPYGKLPKHLHSAITKLFYCFSRGLKMEEIQKLQKFHFFLFANLRNLLERAYNHIKLYKF